MSRKRISIAAFACLCLVIAGYALFRAVAEDAVRREVEQKIDAVLAHDDVVYRQGEVIRITGAEDSADESERIRTFEQAQQWIGTLELVVTNVRKISSPRDAGFVLDEEQSNYLAELTSEPTYENGVFIALDLEVRNVDASPKYREGIFFPIVLKSLSDNITNERVCVEGKTLYKGPGDNVKLKSYLLVEKGQAARYRACFYVRCLDGGNVDFSQLRMHVGSNAGQIDMKL